MKITHTDPQFYIDLYDRQYERINIRLKELDEDNAELWITGYYKSNWFFRRFGLNDNYYYNKYNYQAYKDGKWHDLPEMKDDDYTRYLFRNALKTMASYKKKAILAMRMNGKIELDNWEANTIDEIDRIKV